MTKLFTTFSILLIATASYAQIYTVESVIDGDSIRLTNGESVELIGIDAPDLVLSEFANDVRSDVQHNKAQAAIEFVKKQLKGGDKVYLEFDIQEKDRFKRLLAYVYIPGNSLQKNCVEFEGKTLSSIDGDSVFYFKDCIQYNFLNATLIASGYAQPMPVHTNVKHIGLFKQLYEKAKEQKRGLWADLDNEKPRLTSTEAIDIAVKYKESDDKFLAENRERTAKYDKEKEMWIVSFDSVIKKPGSRSFIFVNDKTGNVDRVLPGM